MTSTGPDDPQLFDYVAERIARGLGEPIRDEHRDEPVDGNGTPPDPPDMDMNWRASVDARLEGLKGSIDSTRWVVGIVAVVMIGGFGFLGFQLNRLEGRVDRVETAIVAIPARLSDEFRAMRAEMAAQTSAIANSITAVRQAQPPPPQVIVVPTPLPSPAPEPRKP